MMFQIKLEEFKEFQRSLAEKYSRAKSFRGLIEYMMARSKNCKRKMNKCEANLLKSKKNTASDSVV